MSTGRCCYTVQPAGISHGHPHLQAVSSGRLMQYWRSAEPAHTAMFTRHLPSHQPLIYLSL